MIELMMLRLSINQKETYQYASCKHYEKPYTYGERQLILFMEENQVS